MDAMRCNSAVDDAPNADPGGASAGLPPRTCRRCGTVETGASDTCRSCRSFLPSNALQLRHGGRRRAPLANVEASDLFVSWVSDLGGESELTTAQRAVLRRAAEADAVAATAFAWLRSTREHVTSDRSQKVVSVLLSAATSLYRAASLLGLERRSKPLPDLATYLRQRTTEAEAGEGAES